MNTKYKTLLIALVFNILFSMIMAFININLGLVVMILGIIIVPIVLNIISLLFGKSDGNVVIIFIMVIFNILYYIVSAKSIMNNPKFSILASSYSHEKDGFYVHMNTNLISLSQLIFLFLLYFVMTFLLAKLFIKRGKKNVKGK